jgi:hypothetical protein
VSNVRRPAPLTGSGSATGTISGTIEQSRTFWHETASVTNRVTCARMRRYRHIAGVVKLADARDSKSRDLRVVRVRPPPPAPQIIKRIVHSRTRRSTRRVDCPTNCPTRGRSAARLVGPIDLRRRVAQRLRIDDRVECPGGWSSDGKWLLFQSDRTGNMRRVDSTNPEPLMTNQDDNRAPLLSPDGQWVLYFACILISLPVFI